LYDGDAADLGLDFTITYERFGETVTQDLRYDGSRIDVTDNNKHAYIQAVARFHMVDRLKKPSEAFVGGLADTVDVHLLKAFAAPELQVLISGADAAIDVDDLRKFTRYENCRSNDSTIQRFWAVVKKLAPSDWAALLKFVTACEPFTIRKIPDSDKLPSASTCFNTLKLPSYSSEKVLRERLLTSIHSGAGFDLS
jgi:ubiquitin-protein ligase E3 C